MRVVLPSRAEATTCGRPSTSAGQCSLGRQATKPQETRAGRRERVAAHLQPAARLGGITAVSEQTPAFVVATRHSSIGSAEPDERGFHGTVDREHLVE
jgi:hypothetical protein